MPRNSNRSWPYDNFRKMSVDLSQTRQTAVGPPRLVGVDGRELGGLRRDVGFKSLQLSQVGLLQTQARAPTWFSGFEIQKGVDKKNLIRGFAFLDGSSVLLHWYDTQTGTFPLPHFVSTSFTGTADDLDLTVRGKFIYITGVGTAGAPMVVWHDGTDWMMEDMGPLILDGWVPAAAPTAQATGGLLSDGDYLVAVRKFNSERGVFDGTSKLQSVSPASATTTQIITWEGLQAANGFDQAYLYRSVRSGTTMYLESILDLPSAGFVFPNFGSATLGLTDQQLQLQDTFEPFVDPVRKPPKTDRINTFQGITVMKLTGDDAGEQAVTDLIWTKTERVAPEEFGPDNVYPGPSNIGSVIQFINAGDFLLGITPVSTIRIQKAGIDMAIQPIHRGWGPLSRYAAVDFGPAVMIAGPRGLYFIEASSGRLQLIEAVDRLMTNNDEWLLDILADQGSAGAPNIQLAYDEPLGCIFILNSVKKEAICFWTKTSRVTIREDMPFTLATTAVHPVTGGARRAMFAGIATGGSPAFVQADKVFFPDSFREGPDVTPTFENPGMQTMHGALNKATKVNGLATGGTVESLIDTSNTFGMEVFGAFVHVWQTIGGVETRTRVFAVPAPAFVLDDFNRADAPDLGPNWSQTGSGTSDYWNVDYWSADYWSADYWASSSAFAIAVSGSKALGININAGAVEYAAIWNTAVPAASYDVEASFTADAAALPWFQLHGRRISKTEFNTEGYLMTAATKTAGIAGRTLTADTVNLEYVSPVNTKTLIGSVPFAFVSGTTYTLKMGLRNNVLTALVDGKEVLRRVVDDQAIVAGPQFKKDDLLSSTFSVDRVDSNRMVVCYSEDSDSALYVRIATVSGTDITWAAKSPVVATPGGFFADVAAVDVNTVLVGFFDANAGPNGGEGKITKFALTDTTLTINSTSTFAPSVNTLEGARYIKLARFDSGTYGIAWIDWEKDGFGIEKKLTRARILTAVGPISMGPTVDIHSGRTNDFGVELIPLTSTTAIVTYADSDDDNKGKLKVITVSAGIITQGPSVTFHGSAGGISKDISYGAARWSDTEAVISFNAVLEQDSRSVVITVSGLDATIGAVSQPAKFANKADWVDMDTVGDDALSFGANQEFSPALSGTSDNFAVASLSSTKVVAAYLDNSSVGKIIVGDVTGITVTWGPAAGTTFGGSRNISISVLSSTKCVMSWIDLVSAQPFAVVITVTGLSATLGVQTSSGQIESPANPVHEQWTTAMDSTHAIIMWKLTGASAVKAMAMAISGSTISTGVFANINNPSGNHPQGIRVESLDSTRWLVAMSNGGGNEVILQTGDLAGLTVSAGASTTLQGGSGATPAQMSLRRLTSTTAVLAFQKNNGADWSGKVAVITVTGADVTAGPVSTFKHVSEAAIVGFDVAVMTPTSFSVSWMDSGAGDTGNSILGTVSGTSLSFPAPSQVWFVSEQTGGLTNNIVRNAPLGASSFIALAQNQVADAGLAFIAQATGLTGKRLVLTYRDVGADNFGKARIGNVVSGEVVWVEYSQFLFPTTPAQIASNSADARINRVTHVDFDTAFVFTKDAGDGGKGKAILLEVPTLGAAQILLSGGFAGFGISFDAGSESASVDDFRIIEEVNTIGLTPSLPQAVASGDRYAIAPVPFRVTFPALSEEGAVDHFRRTIVETMKGLISNYRPNQVTTVNEKMRFQVFRNGNKVEHAGKEVNLDVDQDDFVASFGGVSGHVMHPGMESFASNSDMELIAVRVEGGVTDSDIDQ